MTVQLSEDHELSTLEQLVTTLEQLVMDTPHRDRREQTRREIHNAAIDRASEVMAEWLANGRDESVLFDRLQDLRIWTD